MRRFMHRFSKLQWKLTLSYVLITGLVLLLFELLAIFITFLVIDANRPQLTLYSIQQQVSQAATYFVRGTPDREGLIAWIHLSSVYADDFYPQGFLTVVDKQGQVITSIGEKAIPAGTILHTQITGEAIKNLHDVLAGRTGTQGLISQEANGRIIAISPIVGKNKTVQAALVLKTGPLAQANAYWIYFYSTSVIPLSMLFIIFIAGFIGSIAGFLTARNFTRRFQKLSLVADKWSQGDFAVFAQDKSRDELGHFARHLNSMAEQLQNLLQTRQKLAILEERNRLARDLHDSVKQHIFVVALQVGTAKLRLGSGAKEVYKPLSEAEQVLLQIQQELKTLIQELRPIALENNGFAAALQEMVMQWSQQTTITANLEIASTQKLSLLVEEAFFRVTQEGLANVARHSQATEVQLQVTFEHEKAILTIRDNGRGFALDATHKKGVGLSSMQERMKALDGDVHIESMFEQGTCIVASCKNQCIEV